MKYRAFDLNLLVVLHAVFEHLSVTKAAQALNISQPAVSAALGKLRRHFADELITVVGRKMVLTPKGERVRGMVQQILRDIDVLGDAGAEPFAPETTERRFSIVSSDYAFTVLLGQTMHRFARQAPRASMLHDLIGPSTYEQFENGEIDLMMIPEPFAFSGHPQAHVFNDRYVCLVWSGLAGVGDSIDLEQYLAMPHLVRQSRVAPRQTMLDQWFLQNHGYQRTIRLVVSGFSEIPALLVGTDMIATVQSRLAESLAARLPIRIVKSPLQFPLISEVLQWHAYASSDPAIQWFRELILRTATELLPPIEPDPPTAH